MNRDNAISLTDSQFAVPKAVSSRSGVLQRKLVQDTTSDAMEIAAVAKRRSLIRFEPPSIEVADDAPFINPQSENLPHVTCSDPVRVVSMFCGCGGLDLGVTGGFTYKGGHYRQLPFKIVAAYDSDPKCVETHNKNFEAMGHGKCAQEVDLLDPKAVDDMPTAEMLVGGFPCQDFSCCGPRKGLESKRGRLYRAMIDYMAKKKPLVVVGENVPHLTKVQNGNALSTILGDIRSAGYLPKAFFLHAIDFGIPQDRIRFFIVAVREDIGRAFGHPEKPTGVYKNSPRTIDWAIKDLIGIVDGSVPNQDQYFKAGLAQKGHGQGDEKNQAGFPSYTIRANAKSRVQFHYSLNRRLTIRECARIQTFPDNFVFPHSATTNLMQIGNAVPPVLAHKVASEVWKFIAKITQKNAHGA